MRERPKINIDLLKQDIREAGARGKDWTPIKLAERAGLKRDAARDLLRKPSLNPTIETVAGLARVLGYSLSRYAQGEGVAQAQSEWIRVIGAVAAGVWRENGEWSDADAYQVAVGPSPYPGHYRFGLVVEGYSMDKVFAPGTVLDCVRVSFTETTPPPGKFVIVARDRNGLRETTCKRLMRRDDGVYELHCESTRSEFQAPIVIGKPDDGPGNDDEISVIAIVIGAYQSFVN